MWPFRAPSFIRCNITLLQVGWVSDPQPKVQQDESECQVEEGPKVIGFVSA